VTRATDTALAMIEVIGEWDGQPVPAYAMRIELRDRVGTASYLHDGARWLREQGVLLVATKARHMSTWRVVDAESDGAAAVAKWEERVRSESLSQMTREAQALARSSHVAAIRTSRNRVVANAINLGADLGMDAASVLAMCEPSAEVAAD